MEKASPANPRPGPFVTAEPKTLPSKSPEQEITSEEQKDILLNASGKAVSAGKLPPPTPGASPFLKNPLQNTYQAMKRKSLSNFFDGKYKPPGSQHPLSTLRDRSFKSNLPFLFAVRNGEGLSREQQPEAVPCATFYDQVDEQDTRAIDGDTHIYMLKKESNDAFSIGTVNKIEANETPLGFHLLLINNHEFEIDDPENLRWETVAVCSILFREGIVVKPDKKIADQLLEMIPKNERDFHFGRAMIDALLEEDYTFAEACLSYGGQVQSVDDHGHFGILCALKPGAERFLDTMLTRTGTKEDVSLLQEELRDAEQTLSEPIRKILKEHVDRLSK